MRLFNKAYLNVMLLANPPCPREPLDTRCPRGTRYSLRKHFNLQKIAKYFRTRSPVSAADVDGWRARELRAPLFMGDDEEL